MHTSIQVAPIRTWKTTLTIPLPESLALAETATAVPRR